MRLRQLFTDHPASVGESYFQHFSVAMSFSLKTLHAGICCATHAVFPFLFEDKGSKIIGELHNQLVRNRTRTGPANGQYEHTP